MKDLTPLIERMVDIEATLGIRLNALSAFLDDDGDLKVLGEAHFSKPPSEDSSASVHVMAYDAEGRVVGKNDTYIGSSGITFDAFEVSIYDLKRPAVRLRVFLKRA